MEFKPHPYQRHAAEHIRRNPHCGLFLDMGLGKTVTTLTAVADMLNELEIDRVLVIAPKKVAEDTWTTERDKWDHLRHLRVSLVMGDERRRLAALRQSADVYVIGRDNVAWLQATLGTHMPFDMIVADELSSFKNSKSKRFKAAKVLRAGAKRFVGLTGTPAPNGLKDLWAQVYLIDQGERLGKTYTEYENKYFYYSGYGQYKELRLHKGPEEDPDYYAKKIYNAVSDICISMKAEDYLQLPKRIDRIKWVTLPDEVMRKYRKFERDLVLSIADQEISATNAAVLTGKLLQFSNGAIYDEERVWHDVHQEKLEALEEELEAANGQPVLVFYNFKHDLSRLMQHFKAYLPVQLEGPRQIADWNAGKISLLLAHPASAGHGLNLQHGGHIMAWFGLNWSLELYQQAVARLDRQGQKMPVINTRIICRDTMDVEVMKSLEAKDHTQSALMDAVKAKINQYKNELKKRA